ncbi:S-layer homology domain-containing protein [Deinococcus sp. YIM 77859]|uniref:S-layer homology domain-containing protein n=1 Tax=Deinococcus sp. YIM 77859 TaxID=1540221 RepID=UPI000554049A|nr:S-layer homology domain-containing protein [Deinococcus sp. YIM 77859]
MKKSLFVLTAALSFGAAAAQTTAPATTTPTAPATAAPASAPQVPTLTDVPAGHWATDAIQRLVSRGIILGYPDGTFRGTQNLTRYEAAVIIARLLDQIRTEGVPSGVTAEDLTALQNAIQELAADLTALGVRVSDLEENAVSRDDFARLEARVEELAGAQGDEAALAGLRTQIDELTARVDEFETLRADVEDNASSIAALNDLTVLLNQDILNLQDRVSALESAQADFVQRADFDALAGRVSGVETRVTNLENAPKFSIGGTISATYGRLGLTQGTTNFDVDRLVRQTGVDFGDGDVTTTDTDDTDTDVSLTFGVRASNLTTANGNLIINSAGIDFGVNNEFGFGEGDGAGNITPYVAAANAQGTLNGQAFSVKYDGEFSRFFFNDYLFNNDNDDFAVYRRGIVADINATQLPFRPKLTVVIGNATGNDDATPPIRGNYFGVRAQVQATSNPASVLGIAYAQDTGDATGTGRSAFGVDWNLTGGLFGPVTLKGAYVASIPNTAPSFIGGGNAQATWAARDQAFYTNATANLGVLRLGANFRAIDPQFANGEAGMSADQSEANGISSYGLPYEANQVGYGAGVGTTLGPINLAAFGDTRTPYLANDPNFVRRTNFGVSAGVNLAGLSLTGFYNRSTVDNAVVHADTQLNQATGAQYFAYNGATPYMGVANVPFAYSSTFGAVLRHDGTASNALVRGLNFTVADAYFYDDRVNDFQVYGNYRGTLGGVTIEPFARYHLLTTPGDAVVTDNGQTVQTYNTVKYGVRLSTQPLNIVLRPSLSFSVANRISNLGRGIAVNSGTATELFGQAALTFNEFIAPNTKATLGYAYYQGFNVSSGCGTGVTVGSSSSAASATYSPSADRFYCSPFGYATPYSGDNFGTVAGITQGVFTNVTWNGLGLNYGIFRHTNLNNNTSSVAQGFKVSYTVRF